MSVEDATTRNAGLDAKHALLNGGSLVFTDGDLGTGNVLATLTLQAGAFGAANAGAAACAGLPALVTPSQSGTVAGWVAKTSGGVARITGHASELSMSSKVLVSGTPFYLYSWIRTAPVGT